MLSLIDGNAAAGILYDELDVLVVGLVGFQGDEPLLRILGSIVDEGIDDVLQQVLVGL